MKDAPPLFEIENLSFSRGSSTVPFVLDIPRLTLPSGKLLAIVGGSGSGKSTLINVLGGLVTLAPVDVGPGRAMRLSLRLGADADPVDLLSQPFPNDRVGRVFQDEHLLREASVASNIAAAALRRRGDIVSRAALAEGLLRVNLAPDLATATAFLDRRVAGLSGGERQRVAICRAMVGDIDLVIADEPTSSLDPSLAQQMISSLRSWVRSGRRRSVLWVSHDYRLVCAVADGVVPLRASTTELGEKRGRLRFPELNGPLATPARPEIIEDWVQGHGDSTAPISARPEPGPTPSVGEAEASVLEDGDPKTLKALAVQETWYGLGLRLARARLLAHMRNDRALEQVAWLVSRGAPRVTLSPFRLLGALGSTFAERALLIRQVLAGLILAVAFAASALQAEVAIRLLNDPQQCHVSIGGFTGSREFDLRDDVIVGLTDRPWAQHTESAGAAAASSTGAAAGSPLATSLSASGLHTHCAPQAAAWPRRAIGRQQLGFPDERLGCDIFRETGFFEIDAPLLVAHRNEPAVASIPFKAARNSDHRLVGDALGSGGDSARRGVIVSQSFIDFTLRAQKKTFANADAFLHENPTLCLRDPGDERIAEALRILGVVDTLPADRQNSYELLVAHDAFATQFTEGESRIYSSAAIYFSPFEVDALRAFLNPTGENPNAERFRFNPQVFEQLVRAIAGALVTLGIFSTVLALIAIFAFVSIRASYRNLIELSRRPLAMLRALGHERAFLERMVGVHAGTIGWLSAILVAVPVTSGLLLASPAMASFLGFTPWLGSQLAPGMLAGWATLKLSRMASSSNVRRFWRESEGCLAAELQG